MDDSFNSRQESSGGDDESNLKSDSSEADAYSQIFGGPQSKIPGNGVHPLNPKREKDWQQPQTTYHVPVPDYENEQIPIEKSHSIRAFIGLFLGLAGILGWNFPIVGFIVTIAGIIISATSLKTPKKIVAILGLVLSIAFLTITFGHFMTDYINAINSSMTKP